MPRHGLICVRSRARHTQKRNFWVCFTSILAVLDVGRQNGNRNQRRNGKDELGREREVEESQASEKLQRGIACAQKGKSDVAHQT